MTTLAASEDDWRHLAACQFEDPDLHFPVGNTGSALLQIEDAKAVCRRCPARQPCGSWALANRVEHGVWGGLSEDDRRGFRRRATRHGHGKAARYEAGCRCVPCAEAFEEDQAGAADRQEAAA